MDRYLVEQRGEVQTAEPHDERMRDMMTGDKAETEPTLHNKQKAIEPGC